MKSYRTNRLLLTGLTTDDAEFIFALVNTKEWIRFIGERNVGNTEEAIVYIKKILANPAVQYWVVKLQDTHTAVGIITFIQRDYLDYPDIGFAFLPAFSGHGYAYEATMAVLNDQLNDPAHSTILAITLPDNKSSIQLLEKTGLAFLKEITDNNELLLLYSITADQPAIDNLVKKFFGFFTTANGKQPDWTLLATICIQETMIIKKTGLTEVVYTLRDFVDTRKSILTNGTLIDFEEQEIKGETKIIHHIAQRFSTYQKSGTLNGAYFKASGHKFFQFIKTTGGWKINSMIWEDEEIDNN